MTRLSCVALARQGVTIWLLSAAAGACARSGDGIRPAPSSVPEPISTITYQPYAARYRGVTRGDVEQIVNGRQTTSGFGVRYDLSVTLDTVGNMLLATVTVDSLPEVTGGGFDPAEAEQVRGTIYSASLTSRGEVVELHANRPSSAGSLEDLITRMLREFFPRLPNGGAAPGARWEDTLETTASLGGVEITRDAVNQHEAVEWTILGDRRALRIVTHSTYDLHGFGEQFGRAFTLTGSGRRHGELFLGENGEFLGRVLADTSTSTVEVDVGLSIPISQTRVDSLSVSW